MGKRTSKGGASGARRPAKRAKKATFEYKVKKINSLYEFDESKLEPPTAKDFACSYGPLREHYTQAAAPPSSIPQLQHLGPAPAPSIPNPWDDTPIYREVMVKCKKKSGGATKRRQQHLIDDSSTVDVKQPEAAEQLSPLLRVPMEVRLEIYRHLLASDKPVWVYNEWKRIYPRDRVGLDTSILRVSKLINSEATQVLYGQNQFHYLVRDGNRTIRDVVDISRLVRDDRSREPDDGADYETETEAEDSEYEGNNNNSSRDHEDIHLSKYGHLMRHLCIQAEANRCSSRVRDRMAEALDVFVPRAVHGRRHRQEDGPRGARIHTLTIFIWPTFAGNDTETGQPIYTFVDFFAAESPVLDMLKAIRCQWIKIEVGLEQLNANASKKKAICTLDMRQLQLQRQWNGDKEDKKRDISIRRYMVRKAKFIMECLPKIEGFIKSTCQKHDIELDITELEEWEYDEDGQVFIINDI